MLRITMSVSPEAASKYFDSALERSDYYAKSDVTGKGSWGGRGAELLGLSGEASREEFVRLASNQTPDGGQLAERTKEKRRAGYDFTFSVPKSVSLYLAETGDKAVEEMIQKAFRETMSDVEERMEGRVRGKDRDGFAVNEDRVTGNLVYASFTHTVTRPVDGMPDPHYHIHAYTFNATFDRVEGRWKAGQFGNIKRDAPFYESAFNGRLARYLVEAGYGIRRTDRSFELASVTRELIEKFSRRTKEIERLWKELYPVVEAKARALARETGMEFADAFAQVAGGAKDSVEWKASLGAISREKKSAERLGAEERLRNWRSEMTPEERASLSENAVRSQACEGLLEIDAAKELAVEHLFERVSIARRLMAAAMLLRRAIGRVGVDRAEEFASTDAVFVRAGDGYVTTKQVLEEERELLGRVKESRGRHRALGGTRIWKIVDARVRASEEQCLAVEHVLRSNDLVTAVRGAAGTGKTSMMVEAVHAVESLSGKRVQVFAPSSSAVEELTKQGFSAVTLQHLMISEDVRARAQGQVLWVDEAGFLSVEQMNAVVRFAEENACRLILSGDSRQHHGVERGDALRILERSGVVEQAALTKIFRQQIEPLREAVSELAAGRTADGFARLDAFGAIEEVEDQQSRLEALSRRHLEALEAGRTSMIVSPTHAEARVVADAVRRRLQAAGMVSAAEEQFERLQTLNWTEGEKKDPVHYRPGQIVEFHRIARAPGENKSVRSKFLSGEQWEVKGRIDGRVLIERNGALAVLPLEESKSFSVYERETLPLAVGDRVRITKNFLVRDLAARQRLRNNEVHVVTAIDGGGVELSNGVRLKRGLWHLDQGTVVTSHAAQGKTVDQVLVSVPVRSFAQVNQAQWYVSLSRARQSMAVYTDSKAALKEAVLRPSDRLSPSEVLNGARGQRGRVLNGQKVPTADGGRVAEPVPTIRKAVRRS